jgi:hypothetical protein
LLHIFLLATVLAITLRLLALAVASSGCTGDCRGDGAVGIDELLTMVDVALGNLPVSACAAGDANGDGRITVDEILGAVANALTSCPASATPTPTSRVVDFGVAFGGGPGGTTFLPLSLSADNIVSLTLDLCFVDSVFTFSDAETFASTGVTVTSFTVFTTPCALSDAHFPQGHTLHIEFAGDGGSAIPTGQFVTLAFDSDPNAVPACYPAQVQAILHASDGGTVTNAFSGVMKIFIFQGSPCQLDCPCSTGFCRDGVCCEEDCQGGTCNVSGSEGLCIRG